MSQAALGVHASARATRAAAAIWLTAARCRLALLLVVTPVAVGHIAYLSFNCPVDLAEDEAYYWDWSRQLDFGYYSKGPLTAGLVRLSCTLFGDTMPAVRLPAIFLRAGVAACAWSLTLRLFKSPRLALSAAILGYAVPIFLPAGLVMTTDPPFLFLWALACATAAKAMDDDSIVVQASSLRQAGSLHHNRKCHLSRDAVGPARTLALYLRRKFASNFSPCSVRKLSG